MNTNEKNMTLSQQFGMIVLKNSMRILLENGVDFETHTREGEDVISKEVRILKPLVTDIIDINGEMYMQLVDRIVFRLPKNDDVKILFYNTYDEILELDCPMGFEIITATFMR